MLFSLICCVHGEFSHRSFYSQELTARHDTHLIHPQNNSVLHNKPLQARGARQLWEIMCVRIVTSASRASKLINKACVQTPSQLLPEAQVIRKGWYSIFNFLIILEIVLILKVKIQHHVKERQTQVRIIEHLRVWLKVVRVIVGQERIGWCQDLIIGKMGSYIINVCLIILSFLIVTGCVVF